MNTAKKKSVKKKTAGTAASEIAVVLSKAMKKLMDGISEKKLFAKDIKDNRKKNAAVKAVKKKAAVKKPV
jgi:hypothetical protein